MITLRLFASLRDLAGQKEIKIEKDAATMQEVLAEFATRFGARAHDMLFDADGNIWPSVMLLINDQPTEREPGTPVKSGDVISILLPTAGG
jgi:MoaD family protein